MATATPLSVVTRTVAWVSDATAAQSAVLAALPGVQSVTPGKRRLTVTYDVCQIQYRQLLDASGTRQGGLIARLRQAWFNNLDRNLADSLQAKAGACCNQPPVRR